MLLKNIITELEKLAPLDLAYKWDNSGLQIGEQEQEVRKILLTLDVTEQIAAKAINQSIDLIISHHPLIFKEIKKISDPLLLKLIRNNVSVYSLHTNLDVVKKGVNFALAEILDLEVLEFINHDTGADLYHVIVYVPQDAVEEVSEAVFTAGAGIIGNYDHCLNKYEVKGQFRPLAESKPAIGSKNILSENQETKLEFFVDSFNLQNALNKIITTHPYETPVYAVYPQKKQNQNYGLGFICKMKQEMTLTEFAETVRDRLQAKKVKLWTAGRKITTAINTVAICGGSGNSLIPLVSNRADVFVSSDITYHNLLDSKIPIIDAGHFYTEFPVLKRLQKDLEKLNLDISLVAISEHDIQREYYL